MSTYRVVASAATPDRNPEPFRPFPVSQMQGRPPPCDCTDGGASLDDKPARRTEVTARRPSGPRRPRTYDEAVRYLRRFTGTPSERGFLTLFVRVAVLSPAAQPILCILPLKRSGDRRRAIIAAAIAVAAQQNERHRRKSGAAG